MKAVLVLCVLLLTGAHGGKRYKLLLHKLSLLKTAWQEIAAVQTTLILTAAGRGLLQQLVPTSFNYLPTSAQQTGACSGPEA
mgnify:CR=1 FL=1